MGKCRKSLSVKDEGCRRRRLSDHLWILAVGTATKQPRASLPVFGARSSPPHIFEFILTYVLETHTVENVSRSRGKPVMQISNVHRRLAVKTVPKVRAQLTPLDPFPFQAPMMIKREFCNAEKTIQCVLMRNILNKCIT
jgi:hypothetical protein